jgi:hypothetical protein
VALSLIVPALALASPEVKPEKPQAPISLQFVGAKQGAVFREVASGWPVTLRLSSNGELGIGTLRIPPFFPRFQEVGYLVFTDPDSCFSFVMACGQTDETYVEFTPDQDRAGLPNAHGNADRLAALTTSGGGGSPMVLTFDSDTHLNDKLVPYGPLVGGADIIEKHCSSVEVFAGSFCDSDADCPPSWTCREIPVNADGYGYGADDDLPGLVLLSDTGVGLVLSQGFNPPRIPQVRNLAGLLSSVAYDLRDGSHRPTILAHWNVPPGQTYLLRSDLADIPTPMPRGLFTPVVLADKCVGDPTLCNASQTHLFRIDGGPPASMTDTELFTFLNERVVTLRAFVVNGTAPSVLSDQDGDGIIGAKDAALAGYQLLSGEEVIQVVVFYDDSFEVLPMLYDFDGNGEAIATLVAPGGPGKITKVPE